MSLKASEQNIKVYAPAKGVRVKVVNTPVYEDDVFVSYKRKVTMFITLPEDKEKLEFKANDSIAKFVETVDFEDPQTELGI